MDSRLKKLRNSLGLSQVEFAKKLGLPNTTVSKYEKGLLKPSFEILSKIGNVYNVNLNWLITNKGDMFNSESGINNNVDSLYVNLLLDFVEIVDETINTRMTPGNKRKLVELLFNAWIDVDSQQTKNDSKTISIKDFIKYNMPLALRLIKTA